MVEFFIFIGVMITVNVIGWAPIFIASFIGNVDIDEALLNWHTVITMFIALLLSFFVLDPSLFNLMWIN